MDVRDDEQRVSGSPTAGRSGGGTSLRELLAGYDSEVEEAFGRVLGASTGTERVRLVHNALHPSIAVHDAVLGSALCPLLEDLPGGAIVADRLREGCRRRTELLQRFDTLTKGVAARNVYPVSGGEVEEIVADLHDSFDEHADVETHLVADVLESAAASADPGVLEARMAIDARRTPRHTHAGMTEHPGSGVRRRLYRFRDEVIDWVDTHHGWTDDATARRSPKSAEVATLEAESVRPELTVRELLASHDAVIADLAGELPTVVDEAAWAETAHRLQAAFTVHDLVVGGVLCPLLEGVPEGRPLATRLRQGCEHRSELLSRLQALSADTGPEGAGDGADRRHATEETLSALLESFEAHRQDETDKVAAVLETLPGDAFRTWRSTFADVMWPWHSQGPNLLALQMALSAETAPTRAHRMLTRHPRSRMLRAAYRTVDHFGDFWRDTALERWLVPKRPTAPFTRRRH